LGCFLVPSTCVEEVHVLVARAASDDADAWSDLVERFGGLIWSIARSVGLTESDAADVSQTTWLRLSEHLDDFHDPSRVGAWLATTARREAIRVSRLGARSVLVDPWSWLERPDAGVEELDTHLLARERDLMVQRAVADLPDRCRRLLLAASVDPPSSYEALSERLDMPIGSIGPTRARCLKHLARLIEGLEGDAWSELSTSENMPSGRRGSR
jgi:RNA polymerase sigma factor (sigma-70 family)